jgi:lysozyme family protein
MSFETAVNTTLQYEGGYVNDPNDPGGETNFGISKKAYPNLDIKNLTIDDAKAIYKRDYWDKLNLDTLPEGITSCVFDSAVNQGIKAASILLQRAAGVKDDGVIGSMTLAAVKAKDPAHLIRDFTVQRILMYSTLSGWQYYSKNWTQRSIDVALTARSFL